MSKILKNETVSAITITDTGITIPASPGQYTIPPQDYDLWANSNDVITPVGTGDLVVNDGSIDLTPSEGIDLIKGLFPRTVTVDEIEDPVTIDEIQNPVTVDEIQQPVTVDEITQPVTIDDSEPIDVDVTNLSSGDNNWNIFVTQQVILLQKLISEARKTNKLLSIILDDEHLADRENILGEKGEK